MPESDETCQLDWKIEPHADPVPVAKRAALLKDPGFGKLFTDHMAIARYTVEKGWHDAQIRPREPISLDPAASVLHYAQEIFEGMKAYRLSNGQMALFRPEANAARFAQSADRMAMPRLPHESFLKSVKSLVEIDKDWIPDGEGGSLYLRPFMFASEVFLGVRPSQEYLYMVIASPAGAYFKGGAKAVTIWVSDDYSRAAPGGTGAAKCGGNYAASLVAQAEAIEEGCDQVVFLDAAERKWVEELGGMNLFFVKADGSIVTPPLTGTILPGITRDSIITLLKDEGVSVREEAYSIDQWEAEAKSGTLKECFACGTAAVVTAVGSVRSRNGSFSIGDGQSGPVTEKMRSHLSDLQRGLAEDPHGWVNYIGS